LDADSFEKIIGDCKNSADHSTPDAVNSTDLPRPVNDTIIIDDDDDSNASEIEVTNTDISREIMNIMTDLSPVVNETDYPTTTDFDTPAGGEPDLSTDVVEDVASDFVLPMNLDDISVSVEEEKDLQPFNLQQMFLTELPINTTYNDDNKDITTTTTELDIVHDSVTHTTTTELNLFDFKEEETNCVNLELEQHSDLFETMDLDDSESTFSAAECTAMSDLFPDDFDSILESYSNPVMTDQPMHPTSSTPSSSSSNSSTSSVDAEWGDLLSELFPSLV